MAIPLIKPAHIRLGVFLYDLSMVSLAWLGGFWLRFNLEEIPPHYLNFAVFSLPLVLVVQGLVFWYFGLYRGVWRFASLPDLIRIFRAVVLGLGLSALAIFFWNRMELTPRSVFPLYGLLLLGSTSGSRLAYRLLKDYNTGWEGSQRVLIVGAGKTGEMLVRDLLRDRNRAYRPVAFVDDDPAKFRREIHGVGVRGGILDIPAVARKMSVDLILIALATATAKEMRQVVDHCEKAGIPFRTLPRIQDLASGSVTLAELRAVSIEDLLGREPVKLDWEGIQQWLAGKRVLITGGGGSIGGELCRQVASQGPEELILLDASEYNLYETENRLAKSHPGLKLTALLGDVSDWKAVEHVMTTRRPDIVFHAAAYKHVPILESQVREAVKNNVLGTWNVARAADRAGVSVFVLISTDKAVNPANVMGASKRVAEIFCQNFSRLSKTKFVTVRFGNVLGSSGSVVPLFKKQIAAGGPVTVTHPDITRYFMTIPEACQLILQAAFLGRGGEIFVLDMGDPIKISYLAEQMIRLSGKTPGEDVEIIFTGLRPGEKLFEELFHESEPLTKTGHNKIFLARVREMEWESLMETMARMEQGVEAFDTPALRAVMEMLVPENRFDGKGGGDSAG